MNTLAQLTSPQLRYRLRDRQLILRGGWPDLSALSDFQQGRIRDAIYLARAYLMGEVNVMTVGYYRGITKQRAGQIIRLGLQHLIRTGWLRRRSQPLPKRGATSPGSRPRG